MAEEKRSNQNVMNALCYVPFVAIVLFFMEPKDKVTPDYKRNMMYGIIFFVVSCLLSIFLIWILKGFVALAYIGVSIVFGYKAYNNEDIKIKFIDDFLAGNGTKAKEKKEGEEKKEEENPLKD